MTTSSSRRALLSTVALAAAFTLASCSASGPAGPTEPTSRADATELPGVQTKYPATVLDNGDGPQLCLGMMMMSYPPQCGGPEIAGWDWADWEGQYTEASGVRWGEFWVSGHFDAASNSIELAGAEAAADRAWPDNEVSLDFTTPCVTPAGGWHVVDSATTTQETLDRALTLATTQEGHSGSWVDQSVNPLHGDTADHTDGSAALEDELSMNDPALLILNVRTTGDLAQTEAELREVWGGMLCVSAADHSEAELQLIMDEIQSAHSRQVLSTWSNVTTGRIEVGVLFDDGALQSDIDARYGAGLVTVDSALAPWN